jgi:hypothetical protein
MPLKAILGEVKEKWGVDVDNWQLHKARRIGWSKEMVHLHGGQSEAHHT